MQRTKRNSQLTCCTWCPEKIPSIGLFYKNVGILLEGVWLVKN